LIRRSLVSFSDKNLWDLYWGTSRIKFRERLNSPYRDLWDWKLPNIIKEITPCVTKYVTGKHVYMLEEAILRDNPKVQQYCWIFFQFWTVFQIVTMMPGIFSLHDCLHDGKYLRNKNRPQGFLGQYCDMKVVFIHVIYCCQTIYPH
jgi:hypothetical protein